MTPHPSDAPDASPPVTGSQSTDQVAPGPAPGPDSPGLSDTDTVPPSGSLPEALSRRAVLGVAVGAVGGALAHKAAAAVPGTGAAAEPPAAPAARAATQQSMRTQGQPASALGERSRHARIERHVRRVTSSGTPHGQLNGIITPSDLHYERHHAGIPDIDPDSWRLMVHGMVERPVELTLADLKRMPSESRIYFLECSGNYGRGAPAETPPGLVAPLTSCTEWTGVPLSVLFREVGVSPDATWFLAEGQDGAALSRSIPIAKGWEDSMLAFGQNGEPLRPAQGFPVRLLNPGWEGNTSVKWLRRLELADGPFMTREETSRYTENIKDGAIRQFSFVMDARSLITYPAYPDRVQRGWHEVRGIAWSGRGRIARVDLSVDGGRTWTAADLQDPVLPKAHTRFRYLWDWDGSEAVLMSRAVDDTGYVQPTQAELIAARGPDTAYHLNPITGWRVRRDGTVLYRTQEWTE